MPSINMRREDVTLMEHLGRFAQDDSTPAGAKRYHGDCKNVVHLGQKS